MKALVNTGPYVLQLQDWPIPDYGPQDLLIRVKACAICGSDIKGYSGKTGRRQPPIIMGHEAAGVVEAVGDEVKGFRPGDRVCFDSTVYCLHCEYCLSGQWNLCSNRQVVGVSEGTYRRHGAMAEYVVVPHWIAVKMPDNLSFAQAALIETAAIGLHAANRTPLKLNDTVVVVGAGAVGLVSLQAIRLKGAGKVIVTDLAEPRLALARQMGADVTVRSGGSDLLERLREATGPEGADAVIEAVGVQPTIDTALAITRKGGALTLVGNVTPRVELDLQSIVSREISLYGVCASNGEYADCVELVASGRINVDPFISEYARLEDGQAVFDRLYKGVEDNLRTVFVFD
ncbi:MAG: galactitol-1-phosphate 5-dehydrogenase [Chloroflexi bacterium]|nr:galactitol-1-phosphate 5-dehydrogenase [Chloroflexota bacterium]